MKFIILIITLLIFFILLTSIYLFHINFFHVNVIFYSAIFDTILATLFTLLILHFVKHLNIFSFYEKFQISIICLLIGYSLSITIPTIIDRSLSFYILEKIEQRGGGIKQSSFEEIFVKEYISEYQLVNVRLTEQLMSGTIIIEDGCVKLTEFGKKLASFSQNFRKHFLAKKRLLSGEYTDKLVKLNKINSINNKTIESYKCK